MLIIRAADIDDAPAIARVHVDTWRTTYTGIIPQHYLDSLTVQNRSVGWVRLLERTAGLTTLVSEDHDGRIVGFISTGPLRHRDPRFQAEISSLYVLKRYQGANHGRRLFLAAADRMAKAGYKGLFLWVLANNPARGFYEGLGGVQVSEAHRSFAGKPLHEIGYGWEETPRYGA
jgi:ribosomal protein S18 acetylase RimI-like enzyme